MKVKSIHNEISKHVLVLDGAMGTMIQQYQLDEAAFRGERFRDFPFPLERRADRGSPVAAFVLGVLAAREDDHKQAAKRLEKALVGHGDACRAALLYLSALQAQDEPSPPNRAALRALHARNAQCPIPEVWY